MIGQFQLNDPTYHLYGFEPRDGQPGRIALHVNLPNLPPIPVVIVLSRDRAEEMIIQMRKCLDVAKGLKPL